MDLFAKKTVDELVQEAGNDSGKGLKRVLGTWGLIALGVGVIIGAGLFSVTGIVAGEHTGPAIILSFALAAVCCALAALCYAEFASMIPVAGSAYTYSYFTMGELVAWIIGWDLVLEYALAAMTVSISWSRYFCVILGDIGIHLPIEWTACPADGGVFNLPATLLIVALSLILMRGTKGSSKFNDFLVVLKIAVVIIFIGIGVRYMRAENLTPFLPANTGVFGEYGWSGVLRGAAIVFFAFLGFDAISTAAQETKNPRRNMPIGILGSLLICTVLYMAFALVMTGVVDYHAYKGADSIAPAATAIAHMGSVGPDDTVVPAYPWLNRGIILAILMGYASVVLVTLLGQSRVFYSMSRDGLLPPLFSHLHKRFHTPARSNLLFMTVIGLLAGVVPASVAGEMTSIGTLLAFSLVCLGVIVVRRTQPNAPRSFKTPFVPWIPATGVLCCVSMMLFLPADTWIRLVMWMLIGLDVYSSYGVRHSHIGDGTDRRHGQTVLNAIAIFVAVLCIITALWHQQTLGWEADKTLFWIGTLFGLIHIFYYLVRSFRPATVNKKE
ncbi:MAG: amino acid permease [Prevotellamassilia sp.]|nr:amino acid permease [Prevotellamassilia sp.]